jgi:hypothetical protein
MSLNAELATGTFTTVDVAIVAAVPSGQLFKSNFLTIQQPAGSTAKLLKIGRGTTATAANVKLTFDIPAGKYSAVLPLPFALPAGATLNGIVDTGTTELSFTVQGTKDIVA